MKKILLTGASGFVGKNILEKLSSTYQVIDIGSKQCDLRQQTECENLIKNIKPDIIIHAAGTVGGIGANKDNPGIFLYDNLIMGTNIIHSSMINKIDKFIMLGTVCSYPKYTNVPFNESELWNGYPEETNAPYGIAKKTLMKLIEVYNEQYGFNGVNLIPVNMYGPYDHFNLTTSHVIPALILKVQKAIENNEKFITIWGTGQASREFLFAPDCADAIELAISNDVPPTPINIGTGKEIKICELVRVICDIMGYTGDIVYDNTKPDGQPRRCLDTSKSKEILGFEAKTDLFSGLNKTIDWFKNTKGK
jgi:GDP-L-fucose synthase